MITQQSIAALRADATLTESTSAGPITVTRLYPRWQCEWGVGSWGTRCERTATHIRCNAVGVLHPTALCFEHVESLARIYRGALSAAGRFDPIITFPVGSEGWFALERAFALLAEAGADYTTSAGVTVRGWRHEPHGTPGNPHVWHWIDDRAALGVRCGCGIEAPFWPRD